MAIQAPKAPSWINADGLTVYYGTKEGVPGNGGEYQTLGPVRTQEFILDLATLTTTAQYLDQFISIPKGAFIEQVEVETLVSPSGASTLSIGLKRSDQTTNISDTALVAALTVGNAGTKALISLGSTGAGSQFGTVLPGNGLYTALRAATAYTAGRVAVRVRYQFLPLT